MGQKSTVVVYKIRKQGREMDLRLGHIHPYHGYYPNSCPKPFLILVFFLREARVQLLEKSHSLAS